MEDFFLVAFFFFFFLGGGGWFMPTKPKNLFFSTSGKILHNRYALLIDMSNMDPCLVVCVYCVVLGHSPVLF